MTESTAPEGASTPESRPSDPEHPFAEIIELFRGIAEGSAPRSSDETAGAPTVAAPSAREPAIDDTATREPIGLDRTLPIPEPPPGRAAATAVDVPAAPADRGAPPSTPGPGRRGAPARIGIVLLVLALTGAAGLLLARGPFGGGTDRPDAAPITGRQPSVPEAPRQQEYAEVLADVAAATDLDGLSAAAERAYDLARTFTGLSGATPAGRRLIEAQTASLQALGGLDAIDAGSASTQFPATVSVLSESAASVQRARRGLSGSDPATDPTAAVRNVVRLVAPVALDGLDRRLAGLLDRAGQASKTAGLRDVAARADRSRLTLEDTVAALRGSERLRAKATALQDAYAELGRLRAIDGDHLEVWSELRPALAGRVDALGLDARPLERVDATVATAQLLMSTWRELVAESATPTRADVAAYATRMRTVMDRYARAMAGLPALSPTQQYDFALTTRIQDALEAVTGAQRAVDAVPGVPETARAEHRALVALVARGREAARLANRVAQAVEVCLGTACSFGDMTAWPAYRSALAAIGSLDATRARWESAAARAERDAPAAAMPAPARPVV